LKVLGFGDDQFEVKIAQQVNLIEDGKKVKMSKRLGKYQTMSDLLDYLGVSGKDVGRYFFLMRSQDSPLDFDLDLAKEQSDKNPVFYLQYAHARICSIFREVGEETNASDFESLLSNATRDRLIWILSRYPEEVADSAEACEPHRLINYLQVLAKTFTKFYLDSDNILKKKEGSEKSGLLYLLKICRIALSEGLAILGISHPESM
jgi:arginyl-tRNA synthetase